MTDTVRLRAATSRVHAPLLYPAGSSLARMYLSGYDCGASALDGLVKSRVWTCAEEVRRAVETWRALARLAWQEGSGLVAAFRVGLADAYQDSVGGTT